jgi:SAM-dependent methyltransferase
VTAMGLLRTLTRALFTRVIKPPYVFLRRQFLHLVFERRSGIETAVEVPPDRHEVLDPSTDWWRYNPVGWLTLRRLLPRLEVSDSDVFLDLGSGKGRAVFLAARDYPFRRVIGIEISRHLNAIAQANIDRNRERLRCQDVELLTGDLFDYEIPDDATVVFFALPPQPRFDSLIDKLFESVDRRPRRLRFIYGNPIQHEELLATSRVRPIRRVRQLRPGADWSRSGSLWMYEILPASSREDTA